MEFPTEQTRVALVKKLLQAAGEVRRARNLVDLGWALVCLESLSHTLSKTYGLVLSDAGTPESKIEVRQLLSRYFADKILALNFPHAPGTYGQLRKLILHYGEQMKGDFTVDDLRKCGKKLKSLPRQTIQVRLHELARAGILVKVSGGQMGANGTPAVWRIKDNKKA